MIETIHAFTLPAALSLLPARMDTPAARAMLLAIGLQESRFTERRQRQDGPARGFWMFERVGGVHGVLTHPRSTDHARAALDALRYPGADRDTCWGAMMHNDVLACVFARLLLWTLPGALPGPQDVDLAWDQYLAAWRPGKPHRSTWDDFYREAWKRVSEHAS